MLEKCERQLHADEDAEAHAWSQTLAGERSVAALSSVAQRGGQGSVTGVLCCVDAMKELHAQAVVLLLLLLVGHGPEVFFLPQKIGAPWCASHSVRRWCLPSS